MLWEGDSLWHEVCRSKTDQIGVDEVVALHCSGEGELCTLWALWACATQWPPSGASLFSPGDCRVGATSLQGLAGCSPHMEKCIGPEEGQLDGIDMAGVLRWLG